MANAVRKNTKVEGAIRLYRVLVEEQKDGATEPTIIERYLNTRAGAYNTAKRYAEKDDRVVSIYTNYFKESKSWEQARELNEEPHKTTFEIM